MREKIEPGDIVLFSTGFDRRFGEEDYYVDYPVLGDSFAEFLVSRKVKIVGIDTPSPDKSPYSVHVKLFENGIFILENLVELAPLVGHERVELFAFPLKMRTDSSPVRVVARVI